MKKKIFLFSLTLLICILYVGFFTAPKTRIAAPLEITSILSNTEKGFQTTVYSCDFTDEAEGRMVYHLCITKYDALPSHAITELHTAAVTAVFDIAHARLVKKFDSSGHPAAIYQSSDCNYICCTTSPEASVVLEYDPSTFSEDDVIRSIRSIYEKPRTQ